MKVLLLDTAFASAPIYDSLCAAGHEVWVMGNRSNDLLARRIPDCWIEQDYSDVTAVEAHVRTGQFSRVIPGCTDVSISTCASLSLMNGHMDCSEAIAAISDKARFREICSRLKLRAPRTVPLERLPTNGRMVCKPVDAFSGRGISIFEVSEPGALECALAIAREASSSGRAIVETFVAGQLHSCSGFLEHGRLVESFYVIEGSSANPFAVDTSYVTDEIPETFRAELKSSIELLAEELALVDGLIHTQFILADDGAYIIEVSRRCPGDLYPLLIEFATGYPYAARYASCFLGEMIEASYGQKRKILRHTVTADKNGIYCGFEPTSPLSIISFFPLLPMGEQLLSRQGNRASIVFSEASDDAELSKLYDKFMRRCAYTVTNDC